MATAAVVGASGYLGGELLRLLDAHPQIDRLVAVARNRPGESLGALYPNLERWGDVPIASDPSSIDADVAFVALPAGEAMHLVPSLLARGIRVVDLGADYRLPDVAEFARVYGQPHVDPAHLASAVYGLAELFREEIRSAALVANPGCYATATILALAPLVRGRAISGPIVVDAKSGTSGAGATLSTSSHHPEAAATVLPYGLPVHRHVPEIRAAFDRLDGGAPLPPMVFVPHLVPLVRGILCSVYATPRDADGGASWERMLRAAYPDDGFVRVGPIPRLVWALGTNRCYLSAQSAGELPVVFSALDNLGKGGAAQAVQNANLMFGWPETTGLAHAGFGV